MQTSESCKDPCDEILIHIPPPSQPPPMNGTPPSRQKNGGHDQILVLVPTSNLPSNTTTTSSAWLQLPSLSLELKVVKSVRIPPLFLFLCGLLIWGFTHSGLCTRNDAKSLTPRELLLLDPESEFGVEREAFLDPPKQATEDESDRL